MLVTDAEPDRFAPLAPPAPWPPRGLGGAARCAPTTSRCQSIGKWRRLRSHIDGCDGHPHCLQGVCAIFLQRAHIVSASSVHVERWRGALDDLFRDHDLLDAFEARKVEHGVE